MASLHPCEEAPRRPRKRKKIDESEPIGSWPDLRRFADVLDEIQLRRTSIANHISDLGQDEQEGLYALNAWTVNRSEWITNIIHTRPPTTIAPSIDLFEDYILLLNDIDRSLYLNRTSLSNLQDINSKVGVWEQRVAATELASLGPLLASHIEYGSSHFFQNAQNVIVSGGTFVHGKAIITIQDNNHNGAHAQTLSFHIYIKIGVLFWTAGHN